MKKTENLWSCKNYLNKKKEEICYGNPMPLPFVSKIAGWKIIFKIMCLNFTWNYIIFESIKIIKIAVDLHLNPIHHHDLISPSYHSFCTWLTSLLLLLYKSEEKENGNENKEAERNFPFQFCARAAPIKYCTFSRRIYLHFHFHYHAHFSFHHIALKRVSAVSPDTSKFI